MPRRFEVGDRVVVTSSKYPENLFNELGNVSVVFRRSNSHVTYGVKLDNYTNPKSAKGLYWFEIYNIKLENEREEISMFNNYTVAEISFLGSDKTCNYHYALFDPRIVEGDTVVVNTGHHGFALAKVVAIHTDEEKKKLVQCNREVVCLVDFSEFYARKEALKKAVELKRDMEKRIREAQELALYEALAEKDPLLRGMLDEYKALIESCK